MILRFKSAVVVAAILCGLAFSSCQESAAKKENTSSATPVEKEKEETKEPVKTVSTTGHVFGHHESSIKLPANLKQVSIKQYDAIAAKASETNKRRVRPLADIKRLKDSGMFLVDPSGLKTVVLGQERESYLKLEKKNAGKVLGLMASELNAIFPGAKMEKVEATLKSFKRAQYCKGKYKITYGGTTFYQTSYFISTDKTVSKQRTILMHVNSSDGSDLEEYITQMSVK